MNVSVASAHLCLYVENNVIFSTIIIGQSVNQLINKQGQTDRADYHQGPMLCLTH